MSVDPLASDMPSWSPYSYTFNNPMRFTDPTGMAPEICPTCPQESQFDEYRDSEESYTYLGNNTVVNESTGSTSEVIEPAAQDNTQVNQQLEGEGSEKTQGGLHLIDPHKSGDQVGALPTGDNADIVESPKTIKYTGANNVFNFDKASPANGHYDGVQTNVLTSGYEGYASVIGGPRIKGGFLISTVSQNGDSVTHITLNKDTVRVDTQTFRALKSPGLFKQTQTFNVPGIVKNPRQ